MDLKFKNASFVRKFGGMKGITHKMKMKNILILIITLISLGLSTIWMVMTKYDYEPIIVTLGLITFLITFSASQSRKISNTTTIKGNYNFFDQTIELRDKESKADIENNLRIEGDNNTEKQGIKS